MHHRRRSRRRDKRTMLPCGCCEDIRGGKGLPQINENEVCMGKAKKAKPKPKKDKCPVNRVHEWYKEVITEESWVPVHHWWYGYQPGKKEKVEHTYNVRTCIHCWKVVKTRYYEPYRYSNRKLVLPKRPVKF